MTDEDAIRQFGLPSAPKHRNEIRAALEAEMSSEGDWDLIKCLLVQLFSIKKVEDSILIWQVKSDDFDSMCSIDVQLLCGAGVDETMNYLTRVVSDVAADALKYLKECVDAGDFEGWTPDKWVRHNRFYYGLDSELPPDI